MEKRIHVYNILQRISVIIGILSILLPILFWKQIPAQIPSHYNASGIIDNWSEKSFLVLLFFMILVFMGGMSITAYYLKISGISPHASEEERRNMQYIYPMFVILQLILQLMFSYIIFCSVTCRNLTVLFMPIILLLTFGSMIYFLRARYEQNSKISDKKKEYWLEKEQKAGECYRSKIDWWLGILLIGSCILPFSLMIQRFCSSGKLSISLLVTEIFLAAIILPMFRTRYLLYEDHITLICFTKFRISYQDITGIKETHNPLSSAALSLDRLQIDFRNERGGHEMVLISPVRKKEFIQKIQQKLLHDQQNIQDIS